MTRSEWNALVSRYTAALVTRVNTHDPALEPARDMAVADALLAVLDAHEKIAPERRLMDHRYDLMVHEIRRDCITDEP